MKPSTNKKHGRPFEEDGSFHVDKGDKADGRPRRLLFRTSDNYVGYSQNFRRKEAYEAAMAVRARANFASHTKHHAQ